MDIVERLREEIKGITGHGVKQMEEIERLREALSAVKECIDDKSYIDAEMIIDNALQQKDSE